MGSLELICPPVGALEGLALSIDPHYACVKTHVLQVQLQGAWVWVRFRVSEAQACWLQALMPLHWRAASATLDEVELVCHSIFIWEKLSAELVRRRRNLTLQDGIELPMELASKFEAPMTPEWLPTLNRLKCDPGNHVR